MTSQGFPFSQHIGALFVNLGGVGALSESWGVVPLLLPEALYGGGWLRQGSFQSGLRSAAQNLPQR